MLPFYALLLITFFPTPSTGACNVGWVNFENACYWGLAGTPTFDNATQTCSASGAHVVTIHSAAEQQFLNTQFGTMKYWVGIQPSPNGWIWVDNGVPSFTNWASLPPSMGCAMANYAGTLGLWTVINCNTRFAGNQGTVCKYYLSTASLNTLPSTAAMITTTTTALPTTSYAGPCPNEFWSYYDGACYFSSFGTATYAMAKQTCSLMGVNATLLTVHSFMEQQYLDVTFGPMKYWVGLDYVGGNWVWVDGRPTIYTNFASVPSGRGCPMANYGNVIGQWTEVDCNTRYMNNQATLCKVYVTPPSTTTAPSTTTVPTTTTTACQDLTDANGNTNCPALVGLCNDQLYQTIMAQQCPRTCGLC